MINIEIIKLKISVKIILFFLAFIVYSCNSSTFKICNPKFTLNKKVFWDKEIIDYNGRLGYSFKYFYSRNTYRIELTDGYENNCPKYIIEKGKYSLRDSILSFRPELKLANDFGVNNILISSRDLGDFINGKLVKKDTLTKANIDNLKFNDREVILKGDNNKYYFFDNDINFLKFSILE